MRKRLSGALAVVASVGVAAAVAVVGGAASPAGAATVAGTYTWQNVAIGGGGFVPGIIFNQTQPNLIYARTDIGGAYRWNQATSSWTPLLDWVGESNWGYNGVVSLASDPVHPNKLFAAVGMYTNSFDPNDGAILRSSDEGDTWQVSKLPFKLGGNMPGRGMGERLAIDPNDDNILYLGAPSGHGLWRSTDGGVTWSQVANFPNVGDYVQDPTDTSGYASDNQGVTWVAFDQGTGTAGSPTKGIYVGVADLQNTVYRSTDGGATWQRIAGQPTGFLAHKGVIDPVNDDLYIATSDKGGPYDGSSGDVWKYAIGTGTWTRISPHPSTDTSNDYYGYSGLALDPEHPGTVMVTGYSSWWPDTFIFRSTDGGATWKQLWTFTSYPNRDLSYTQDITSEPWLTFNTAAVPPVPSPKLGWMTEALAIDPFNANRMFYGTGATLYGTTDLTDWDAGGKITIKPFVKGMEETAVNALISPPVGAPLVSALSDLDGFVHTDVNTVPSAMFNSPNLTSGDSLDYAELTPSDMVRTGEIDKSASPNVNRIGFSTDGGTNWFQGQEPPGVTGGGTAVIAADGSATVWAPAGTGVYFSTSFGGSWTASTGIPQGAALASDRLNPKTFYGFSAGKFYVSTNSGASFTATGATGLPASGQVFIKAVAGHAGDIWLAGGAGLWHSTDGGATFTKLTTVDSSLNVGFGKAAPGQTYPALYAIATVSGVAGVFRSDDEGATWVRINDDQHQYGNIGQAITGDPRIYGRVYLGTNGRGIVYGDLTGTTAAPPPTTAAPPPPTTTAPPPPPPPTTTAPPPASGATCQVTYARSDEWAGGFIANVTVTNTGTTPLAGWTVTYDFPGDQQVTSAWNAVVTQSGTRVTAVNESYNATVAPGTSVSFGFQGTWSTNDTSPSRFAVNGAACG
ncbi:MAG TPA: cellulose binding domain-containing protein [Pseudonocardiaceae bacterium]|nr:cellulose binding domain-containing protein [Pseudonocardiaceae bacterium]